MKLLQMKSRNGGTPAIANGFDTAETGVLPQVWAVEGNLAHAVDTMHAEAQEKDETPRAVPVFRVVLSPETAFYRSYTEAMLRRYGVLSLESGRVPSLLGKEMFRGRVTSYRVHAFDDVVIFVHDVEQCIRLLTPEQGKLILRIGVQEYTFGEAASMLRMSVRSVQRRYFEAVDTLTSIFLKRKLLERVAENPCQEGEASMRLLSHAPDETYT